MAEEHTFAGGLKKLTDRSGRPFFRGQFPGVVCDLYPNPRIAHLRITVKRIETEHAEVLNQIFDFFAAGDEPVDLLIDVSAARWVSMGARETAGTAFTNVGTKFRLWNYSSTATMRVIAKLFYRHFTQVTGDAFFTMEEAMAAAGVTDWLPEPLDE